MRFILLLLCSVLLFASACVAAAERIEDNSFLIEEAYNEDDGVAQYIQSYQYSNESREWLYTFTHEMSLSGKAHQFSYSLPVGHIQNDGFSTGIGDFALNYRYQLIDNDVVALAPRLSVILPTGDDKKGLGYGATGYQLGIPLSVELSESWVSHWNAGATYTPNAHGVAGGKADARGYNYGASIVWLYAEKLNFFVEYVKYGIEKVQPDNTRAWEKTSFVNPGFRYAKNYASGLQMVSGVSFPIGVGPSKDDNGIFVYLSFEQ